MSGANVGGWQPTSSKLNWVQNGQFVFVLGLGKMTLAFITSTRALSIDPALFVLSSGQKVGEITALVSTSTTAVRGWSSGPLGWQRRRRQKDCVICEVLQNDRAGTKDVMWGGKWQGHMERVGHGLGTDAWLGQKHWDRDRNEASSDELLDQEKEKPAREYFVGKGSTWDRTKKRQACKSSQCDTVAESVWKHHLVRNQAVRIDAMGTTARLADMVLVKTVTRDTWSKRRLGYRDVETYKSVWVQMACRAGHRGQHVHAMRARNSHCGLDLERKQGGDKRREVTEKKPAWECSLSRKRPLHVRKQVGLSTQLGQKRRNTKISRGKLDLGGIPK
ncbi:hypothetical protein B0H13DRAFT_1865227 [Mycena leptocephala]|nr:hypothetical protein B0H13DRAFT_1865227 [Mycena leptocephala]